MLGVPGNEYCVCQYYNLLYKTWHVGQNINGKKIMDGRQTVDGRHIMDSCGISYHITSKKRHLENIEDFANILHANILQHVQVLYTSITEGYSISYRGVRGRNL